VFGSQRSATQTSLKGGPASLKGGPGSIGRTSSNGYGSMGKGHLVVHPLAAAAAATAVLVVGVVCHLLLPYP